MDLEYISSHSVVDRYLLGQLSEQEQVEFELYFLENPEILDEVEVARSLKRGLTGKQELLGSFQAGAPSDGKLSPLEIVRGWFQSPAVLAGNFAVIATLLALVVLPGQEPPLSAFTATRVWIGELRGDDAPVHIEILAASLVLDIDVDGTGTYRVSLLDANGQRVRDVEQVAAADALLVVLSTADLAGGRYTLQVADPQNHLAVERELILTVPN